MPVEHQMLDAAGVPGAWPATLVVDRLSIVLGEYRHLRGEVVPNLVEERDQADAYIDDLTVERDQLRGALEQIARVAKACVINEIETYGKPVGDYDEIQGLAEDALNPTDAQEGTA
jgi:hypothetical protein